MRYNLPILKRAGRKAQLFGFTAALAVLIGVMGITEVKAQTMMPIPGHNYVYTGYVRGFWFTAPADFFILGIRVPTDASTSQQQMQIVRFDNNTPPPNYAASTTAFQTLYYNGNVPGTAITPLKIRVNQGEVIGVLGSRWSSAGNFSSQNSYGNGGYSSNIFGQPTTLYRLLHQGGIMTSAAGPLSSGGSGSIGRLELYYGPPCEVPDPNTNLQVSIVDAASNPIAYTEIPSDVYVQYSIAYPDTASPVSITLNFYEVGGSTTTPVFTTTVTDQKLENQVLMDEQQISIPSGVQPGYYRVVPVVNSFNSCHEPQDTELNEFTLMLVNPGDQPCIVWPGDCNADLIVNYGDKKALHGYIHEANLRASWLQGPARYRSEVQSNPLALLDWVPQAAVPWQTAMGCHMDTDGNGMINNFDNIAIRKNWMRAGTEATKDENTFDVETFAVSQNYPNPFNASTAIRYSVPEASHVKIVVMDMLGREVATIVNGMKQAGESTATFNAANLESGNYVAIATLQGASTGTTFTKTLRMTLSK